MVFVIENAKRGGVEKETLRFAYGQFNPTRGQDASEVAMGEERDISSQRPKAKNEPISASGDLRGRFTVRAAVAEEIPVRSRLQNVRGELTFVVAIVPLRQVRFDFGRGSQPGQFTRSSGALPRAGQHPIKPDVPEAMSKFPRPVLARRSQGNIGAAGVPAGERPFGLAVSNEVNAREHVVRVNHPYFGPLTATE